MDEIMRNMLMRNNMDFGGSTAPVSKEFLEKQSAVLATPEGMKLAGELNAYRMGIIDSIVFANEQGRTIMKKYQTDIETLYAEKEADRTKQAARAQEAKLEAQESRIKELEAELHRLTEAFK